MALALREKIFEAIALKSTKLFQWLIRNYDLL